MKKIRILNSFAIILLIFQIVGYLGSFDSNGKLTFEKVEHISYYIGFNLPLIISIFLFSKARSLKNRLKQKEIADAIDSIGKPEKD